MSRKQSRGKAKTRYDELLELRDKERKRIANATVCVRQKELPWEINPQGVMKWYLHPNISSTAHKFLMFYAQQIPPGSCSGKQRCQGGIVVVIVEGRGYTVLDETHYDWKQGDLMQLPITREGVTFQHFNASTDKPVLLIVAEPNLVATAGVDRGSGFEQLEAAPEYVLPG